MCVCVSREYVHYQAAAEAHYDEEKEEMIRLTKLKTNTVQLSAVEKGHTHKKISRQTCFHHLRLTSVYCSIFHGTD